MWRHPEIVTLPDIVRHWARSTPDKTAIVDGRTSVSYSELHELSSQVGHAMVAGLPSGVPVAFLGRNCAELWLLWFGCGKSGRPFVPLNWRLAPPELAALLEDSGAGVVIVEEEYAGQIQRALDLMERPPAVVSFVPQGQGGDGLRDWSGGFPIEDPVAPVFGHDIALIAYTSGTTGRPKGALHTHSAFSFSILSDELEPTIEWNDDDIALMVMPNFHLAGTWVSLPALYHGASLVILPAFEPTAVFDAVEAHQPTFMCLVPTAMQLMLDHERAETTDFSNLKTLVYAGSSINLPTVRKAIEILDCDLRQFLGTTETYIISILRPEDHRLDRPERLASCGQPIPLVKVRITDPAGNDLPDGEVGELRVHTPLLMAGYHNKPEETEQVIEDWWYRTGDVGYRDAEGYLYLVDRIKDMVISGGENIYSIEVERAVSTCAGVSQVAVVGTPDAKWGEVVTACIVPEPGADLTLERLQEHCRPLIADYKIPRIVHLVEALPLTSSGKIRKADVRAMVKATLAVAD